MKPNSIKQIISDQADSRGKYDRAQVIQEMTTLYTEDDLDKLRMAAAQKAYKAYEHSHRQNYEQTELLDKEAILILGENDRKLLSKATVPDAERRMRLVVQKQTESMAAATRELTWWQEKLDAGWNSGTLGKWMNK